MSCLFSRLCSECAGSKSVLRDSTTCDDREIKKILSKYVLISKLCLNVAVIIIPVYSWHINRAKCDLSLFLSYSHNNSLLVLIVNVSSLLSGFLQFSRAAIFNLCAASACIVESGEFISFP